MATNGFLPLIEAFLALALSLAALATVSTVVVEALHRTIRLRFKTQRLILEGLFDEYVAPRLQGQDAANLQTLRQDFMDNVLKSPLTRRLRLKMLGNGIDLSPEDVLRRLPETKLFQQAKAQARQQIEDELLRLADRYESYAKDASDYFKRRAQMTSLIVGVVFALLANVDGLRMFESYRADPALTAQVIEQLDNEADRLGEIADGTDEAAAVRQQVSDIRARMAELSAAGLPIGWKFYPNCFAGPLLPSGQTARVDCRGAAVSLVADGMKLKAPVGNLESLWLTASHDTAGFLQWLAAVIVTGLMIGLGGPFWYDVARRLMQARSTLRGRTPDAPTQTPQPGTAAFVQTAGVAPAPVLAGRAALVQKIALEAEADSATDGAPSLGNP